MKLTFGLKKNRKGFTLAEVLLVVVILGVLAAVAVPALGRMSRNLNQKKLDDTARELFMAAQNSLTAEKASGKLLGDGELWVYSTDGSETLEKLLPLDVVNVEGGFYALRFNAKSAIMLEAYYSETGFDKIRLEAGDFSGTGKASERIAAKIGFHSGDGTGSDTAYLTAPTVSFENGDELKVTVNILPAYKEMDGEVVITVVGKDSGGADVPYTLGTVSTDDIGADGVSFTLDSLASGAHFKDLYPGIVPGSDITVYAKLSLDPVGTTTYISETGSGGQNSLFSKVSGDTAYIGCGRHLQNLDVNTSGVTDAVTKAEQTSSFTWAASAWSGTDPWNDARVFVPIINENLTSYNGNKNEIRNLKVISKSRAGVGLFSEFNGGELTDIRLSNPRVEFTGTAADAAVGALVGYCTGTEISGCQVYDSGTDSPANTLSAAAGSAGGLVGVLNGGTVTDSSASLYSITGTGAVGGLIGKANGGELRYCYADTGYLKNADGEWNGGLSGATVGGLIGSMSGTSTVSNCYSCGYISSAATASGGILGNGSGSGNEISDCYSVVLMPTSGSYGIAGGNASVSDSVYWAGSNAKWDGGGEDKSLSDIKEILPNSSWMVKGITYRYTEYAKNAYPYPMFTRIPHYGDWPMEGVTDIKIFEDSAGTKEVPFVLVPKFGSVSFYAEAMNGTKAAKKLVSADGAAAGTSLVNTNYTKVTFTDTSVCGVKTVMLSCESCEVRAVVIVYDATITLTAHPANASDVVNVSTLAAGQTANNKVTLYTTNPNRKTMTSAVSDVQMDVWPTYPQLTGALASLRADTSTGLSIGASASAEETALLAKWTGYDGPTANNPDLGGGVYVLTVNTTNPLKLTANSAGNASVSAKWKVDPSLEVLCPIEVQGVRAYIRTAYAKSDSKGTDFPADYAANLYPYKVFATPLAKETVTLKLTGETFGSLPSGKTERWSWTVSYGGNQWTGTGQNVSIPVSGTPISALYRVEMKYEYGTGSGGSFKSEYTTADFCYVQVDRKADNPGATGIEVIKTSSETISLEQIRGNVSDYPQPLNKKTVCGCVDGADDTQLLWYFDTDNDGVIGPDDRLISGLDLNDKLPVSADVEGRAEIVADISWSSVEGTIGSVSSIGGTVTVEARDFSYYGNTPVSFKLIARARNNGNEDSYAQKVVTVNIMPKLKIIDSVRTMAGFLGGVETSFVANRSDTTLGAWRWTCDNNDLGGVYVPLGLITLGPFGTGNISSSSYVENVNTGWSYTGERNYNFTCSYGPYKDEFAATASLTAKYLNNDDLSVSISGEAGNNATFADNYYIIERGHEDELTISWGAGMRHDITEDPTNPFITPEAADTMKSVYTKGSGVDVSGTYLGNRKYTVSGDELGTEQMKWKVEFEKKVGEKWVGGLFGHYEDIIETQNTEWGCPIYIVGTEFDGSTTTAGDFDGASDTVTVCERNREFTVDLSSFFPNSVGTGTVQIESSNPAVVSVTGNASFPLNIASVDTHTITLKTGKYGTATVTAVYTVEGRTEPYKDTLLIRVAPVPGTLSGKLEACSLSDLPAAVRTAFGAAASTPAFDGHDDPIMFSDFTEAGSGFDVLYLKAWLEDSSGTHCSVADLVAEADLRFSSSNAYAVSCQPVTVGTDTYLKLTALSGTRLGEEVIITADFGTVSAPPFVLTAYDKPQIVLSKDGVTGQQDKHSVLEQDNVTPGTTAYGFTVALSPAVKTVAGPVSITFNWAMEFASSAYESGYVELNQTTGTAVTASVILNPLSKVAVKVSYENLADPDAYYVAHALVFLPDDES